MELREYQKKVVSRLSEYLTELVKERDNYKKIAETNPDIASDLHYPERAWRNIGLHDYKRAVNGLGEPAPNIYLKVPTGGGKTLLACHSIDLINKLFLSKHNGMVLWIVPTTQIYRQTLTNLQNREHPYRQVLDVSSGGRTLILEKMDRFTPDDITENLCVMLLMLPSASRQSKETLKVFKDNTGYTEFFPAEDAYKLQAKLLKKYPNLDTFGEQGYMWGNLPKTSLVNVLRKLQPITVIDEGHRAYSDTARQTIYGFNPTFVLELSATPPEATNKLIEISGKELNDEQMIKLDLHLINKTTVGWKETLNEAVAMRTDLENKAKEYEQNTSIYIRPIMLVQVERTGRDQRDTVYIHAEDVKEYLIKQSNVPEGQIAIKSSEKDDIEGIDLLSKDCSIRFIITKQALQEGWDCPFAYVLCALTKSQSETAMTQLIGRVLRQPYAKKSGIKELDECYVYSFQHDTSTLVRGIKQNLEGEGLGDLVGRIAVDDDESNPDFLEPRILHYRDRFKKFAGRILLPVFAIDNGHGWREVRYATDLLSRIDWSKVNLDELKQLQLQELDVDDVGVDFTYNESGKIVSKKAIERSFTSAIDTEYFTRQIVDIVPNPWIAFELATEASKTLVSHYDVEVVASNTVFIIEHLRSLLFKERDRLAESVFRSMLQSGEMKFYLIREKPLTSDLSVRSKRPLMNVYEGQALQQSLFDYVPSEDMNQLEQEVALYLDGQQQLLWWYRNMSKADYRIQGWKPNRIYPDFLAAERADDEATYDKVHVLESKGEHLSGVITAHGDLTDTGYKQAVFDLCNKQAVEKSWNELELDRKDQSFVFEMLDENSWRAQLNALIPSK